MREAMRRAHTVRIGTGGSLLTARAETKRMYAANAATTSDLRSKLRVCPANCSPHGLAPVYAM